MPTIKQKFIQALPTDNPAYTPEYAEVLKETFSHRPELLRAYLHGDWDAFEGADQVIKDEWLRAAMTRQAYWPYIKTFITCDTARFGDDETIINLMKNTEIHEKVIMPHCRTTQISNRIAALSRNHDDCMAIIESTGSDLGAGVVDELLDLDVSVLVYNPAEKADEPDKYYNVRAEAWSRAAKALCDGIIDAYSNMPVVTRNLDKQTRAQLVVPTYKFRGTKILIEEKVEIKKRLGRSPDHADAYVIALWGWPYVPIDEPKEKSSYRKSQRNSNRPRSAMTM